MEGQYSEKVMKHFRDPHNVGEIKDASGTGKVGNPVCVIAGTEILCNAERIPVENVTKKARVLGHDGRYHKVKRIFERIYNGKMYKIFVNKIGSITITPEHHVLGVRSYKAKNRTEFFADWFAADELKKNSIILFPAAKEKDYKNYTDFLNKWNDEYYSATVDEIEQLDYKGKIYNLEVEDTRSYVTKCATLHNCGDVMALYIKVEKDIIVDAKFKTFGCLPGEMEVVSSRNGWDHILNVKKGDYVINSSGEDAQVSKIFNEDYQGSLVNIIPFVSPYNSFSVTPTHPVLCVKRSRLSKTRRASCKSNWLRINEKELIEKKPEYIKARNIEESDYIVFAVSKTTSENKKFTKEIMRLIGYYLAEGYITSNKSVVAFAFNKLERKPAEDLKFLIKRVTNKEPAERIRKNVREIYICSRKLVDFMIRSAGSLARNKYLSKEIMTLPFEKQKELIKTYLIGDGNIYRRRAGGSFTYRASTVSPSLAVQIQEILARGGIFASLKKIYKPEHTIEGRRIKASNAYLISFQLERKHNFVRKGKDCFLIPIKKTERTPFKGRVYNLQVASEPNTYLVKGFAVHNCGAAIATSSMVTDLVKGKTVKGALEVSNRAVAEALGGLPKIKMHCSVLAESALKSAIEDYLKKSGRTIKDIMKAK